MEVSPVLHSLYQISGSFLDPSFLDPFSIRKLVAKVKRKEIQLFWVES